MFRLARSRRGLGEGEGGGIAQPRRGAFSCRGRVGLEWGRRGGGGGGSMEGCVCGVRGLRSGHWVIGPDV